MRSPGLRESGGGGKEGEKDEVREGGTYRRERCVYTGRFRELFARHIRHVTKPPWKPLNIVCLMQLQTPPQLQL